MFDFYMLSYEGKVYVMKFSPYCDGENINWYDLSLGFLRCFSHSKREYSGLYDR